MAKEVMTVVKLQIPAGKANPAPPVGTALGPHGIQIMDFCQAFNAQTKHMGDTIVPVEMTIYKDRSFDFITKTPPASILIKKAIGLKSGSDNPLKNKVGVIKEAQIEAIAKEKMEDLNATDLEGAKKVIAGTARSMGVTVEK
jgi:large subunit ribosomal protein L11